MNLELKANEMVYFNEFSNYQDKNVKILFYFYDGRPRVYFSNIFFRHYS